MGIVTALENIRELGIPYYAALLKINSSFSDIPFSSKSDLLDSQKNYPPYGNFTNYGLPISQIYRTSGTTAEPLLLTFTEADIDLITDIGAECYKYTGMGAEENEEVVINCLNLSMWAGGFFDAQSMMKTGVQVVNFGTGNTTELIKLIFKLSEKFKVSIHCTPSYLPIIKSRLLKEYNEKASELNIWKFYLGAEGGLQNHEYRNQLEQEWQCKVYNANYGMSEVCSIMASANDENILRFSPLFLKNYYCELMLSESKSKLLIDLQNDDEGELVITSLNKESQPIIRYRTKENIRIRKNDSTGLFFEVLGRKDDMLVIKGINFFPEQLRSILTNFSELTGAYKVEVTKKKGLITHVNLICEIIPSSGSSNMKLKDKISKKIRDELTISCDVNFVYEIPLTGNKVKLVEIIKEV